MTEDIFKKNVERIERIYSVLIKGETNPQKEVEMRVELIDSLSNLEASLISEKEHNKEFVATLIQLRELLLEWDPYGHWFRQQKHLVDRVYEVMITAKNVVFKQDDEANSESTRLKQELDTLKTELNDLRSLMKSLVKEKSEEPKQSAPQPTVPIKEPVSEPQVIPIETMQSPEKPEITPPIESTPIVESVGMPIPEPTIDPPILLPIDPKPPTTSSDILPEPIPEVEEEVHLVSDSTLQKISGERDPEAQPANVLSQMKSIISDAEAETKKQLTEFKENLEQPQVDAPPTQAEPIIPPTEQTSVEASPETQPIIPAQVDESDLPTAADLPQKQPVITPAGDPYMLLLTLEAEKYRLEKEMEANEAAFQEGSKSKQEFDITITNINKELSIVREQITTLRQQLTG